MKHCASWRVATGEKYNAQKAGGGEVWRYEPATHKTQHLGKPRTIFFGPKAQEVLDKWLDRPAQGFCFDPREAQAARMEHSTAPRQRWQKDTPRQTARKQYTRDHYTPAVYANYVGRACRRAGIDRWSPNQLRHACATSICDAVGIEGASKVLGHAKIDTTGIYTKQAEALAMAIALQMG